MTENRWIAFFVVGITLTILFRLWGDAVSWESTNEIDPVTVSDEQTPLEDGGMEREPGGIDGRGTEGGAGGT